MVKVEKEENYLEVKMFKRIIKRILILIITILVVITGYFFIVDIESKVPDNIKDEISIETKEFMTRKVFEISPNNNEENNKKTILYFHGGAYAAEATEKHWDFLEKLANDTNMKIIMPDYPLTPKYTYKSTLNMVEAIYKETLSKVNPENLIVMGDSAGGGMALGLLEKLSQKNIEMPSKTILISPWLDTTMSNPKIDEVQKNDKDLNKEKLYLAGALYSRNLEESEECFVNPVNGKLSKLKNIIIYTGTYDILNPDCYVLQEKAKKEGIQIEIKEYQQAPHIWIVNNQDELALKAYRDLLQDILN